MAPTNWEWIVFALIVVFMIIVGADGYLSWRELRRSTAELVMVLVFLGLFIAAVLLLHRLSA